MSEMLGNRYFITRQFDKALPLLLKALPGSNSANKIKKKLIVCYIQVGQVENALNLFYELVAKDPMIIINTDPYYDDCPCPELIPDWENNHKFDENSVEMAEALGMLSLYCNYKKAVLYFKKAAKIAPSNVKLYSIVNKLAGVNARTQMPSTTAE